MQPAAGEQLTKFACLDCRRVFKRPVADIGKRNWPRPVEVRRCPSCGSDSYLMSSDFRAPPRDDLKAWEVAAFLTRAGLPYFRLSEEVSLSALGHPGKRPKGIVGVSVRIAPYPETMAEARAFVEQYRHLAQPVVRRPD